MEYDFINDPITGTARANFSLEQQVFGPWLEVEIGNSMEKLNEVEQVLAQIASGKCHETLIVGREYNALISNEEVTITLNAAQQDDNSFVDSVVTELALDQTSQGQCGFEDFSDLLQSWAEFIS